MRTPLVVGNWKMNLTLLEAENLVKGIHYGLPQPGNVDVVVVPPFTLLHPITKLLTDSYVGVGAQNIHWEKSGAFTGEVSAASVKDVGAEYVIVGHSERRQYFGETDETVNKKIKAAIEFGLIPIVCVGEKLDERESNQVESVVGTQLLAGLDDLTSEQISTLIVAYEPVWAIGTGKTASTEQAEDVHQFIRNLVAETWGPEAAESVRIVYGGSVKGSSANELMASENIDGALVGGASLKPAEFIEIIKSATGI